MSTTAWCPTRKAAHQRLTAFLPKAGQAYTRHRNYDLGPQRHTDISRLSPWIRHRLLLEEDVLSATLQQHDLKSAETFVQEVFWRGYFKGWLEHRPQVWFRYGADLDMLCRQLEQNGSLKKRYWKAVEARTGIDCFDAWVMELRETGYVHNHARMWFASIWIFTLDLPWQLGADFFYRYLLDGDPASNTLSWRWVAGLHTKGKTYLARPDNIAKYTKHRFAPTTQFATTAPALEEPELGGMRGLPGTELLPEAGPVGLLITEEDGSPEWLGLSRPPAAVLGLTATPLRSQLPVSDLVCSFAAGAVADTVDRASRLFNLDCPIVEHSTDWGPRLVQWAQDQHLEAIVTAYCPVGTTADCLAAARPKLEQAGVSLVQLLRPYDAAVWPHTQKGFFKVKAQIPKILTQLGL